MNICNLEEMQQYVINCGYIPTHDVFIVEGNVYWRLLTEKQYALKHPGDIMSYRLIQSDIFFCWNYKTGIRRYLDANTFRTQFKLFQFLKDTYEGYKDDLIQEILDNNLTTIIIYSEHLF
jgi:hypothetical protein